MFGGASEERSSTTRPNSLGYFIAAAIILLLGSTLGSRLAVAKCRLLIPTLIPQVESGEAKNDEMLAAQHFRPISINRP